MAHYAKYNKAACGHLFKHFERAKDENGEYIKFSNLNIDKSRTHLNYNLAPMHMNGQGGFVRERCSEVKMQKRADVNVMCSWVVTAPKEIQADEYETFFRETYKFLSERHGRENVVSAYVHMDEITPHIHFAFVPVTLDRKKNILKVSAKEAVSLNDLKTFHNDLSEYIERAFGRDVGVLNEATREGNKSVKELKQGTAIKELAEIKQEAEEMAKLKESHEKNLQEEKAQVQTLKNEKVALRKEITDLENIFKGKQLSREDLERIQPIENIFGSIKNVTVKDIQNLKKMAMTNLKDKMDLDNAQKEIKRLSEDNTRLKGQMPSLTEKLEQGQREVRLRDLEKQNQRLRWEISSLNKTIQNFNEAVADLPEVEREYVENIVYPPPVYEKEREQEDELEM